MDFIAAMGMMRSSSPSLRFWSPNSNPRAPLHLANIHHHSCTPKKHLLLFRSPQPLSSKPNSRFLCSAIASSPSQITEDVVPNKLQTLVSEFQSLPEPVDRVTWLLHYASHLPRLPESARIDSNRVMGCTAQVQFTNQIFLFFFATMLMIYRVN